MTDFCRIAAGTVLLLAAVTGTRAEVNTLPKHLEWNAVPAAHSASSGQAGKVTIDGDLADWDTSAGIYINSPAAKDEFARTAVWAYAMYDDENLYLGFRLYDATPMNNRVDSRIARNPWVGGDSVQVRLKIGDEHSSITSWWSAPAKQPAMDIWYGPRRNITRKWRLDYLDGNRLSEGVEMAFRELDGPAGYAQQMKLPWKVLVKDGVCPKDKKINALLQVMTDGGPGTQMADVFAPGKRGAEFAHTNPGLWGTMQLLDKGGLREAEPVLKTMWQKIELPKDGKMITDVGFFSGQVGVAMGLGRIYRTEDGGRNWNRVAPGLGKKGYRFILTDPPSSQVTYGVGYDDNCGYNVCLKTADAGKTWRIVHKLHRGGGIRALSFADENHGWVANGKTRSVLYTENGGKTWQQGNPLPSAASAVVALDTTSALAAGGEYIYRTTDGKNWDTVKQHPGISFATLHALDDKRLLLGSASGLYASHDGGQTLKRVPLPCGDCTVEKMAFGPDGLAALFCRDDETFYALQSFDTGANWHIVKKDNRNIENSYTPRPRSLAWHGKGLWLVGGGISGFNHVAEMERLAPQPLDLGQAEGIVPIAYRLPQNAAVTLVIEDEQGNRIRNLLSNQPRPVGENTDYWDGRNDAGELMPSGAYRWRGLHHEDLHTYYEFSYNNPGSPPWWSSKGRTGSGGWASDHCPPSDCAAAGNQVFLASSWYEMGDGVFACNLEGRRQWANPMRNIAGRGTYGGGNVRIAPDGEYVHVALNISGDAVVYRMGAEDGTVTPFRWQEDGKERSEVDHICYRKEDLTPAPELPHVWDAIQAGSLDVRYSLMIGGGCPSGLAVGDKYLCLALYYDNKILVMDKHTARHIKEIEVKTPAGIASGENQQLYVVSNGGIVRLDVETGETTEIISPESDLLDAPIAIATQSEISNPKSEYLYISDWGKAMQVKVFSPDGKLLRKIGKDGGRALQGPWDPNGMLLPSGLAVDVRGKLWVAEDTFSPKRFSVWDAGTGRFEKEFIGPAMYGGGESAICPHDPTRAFGEGMEFRLDWDKGTYKLESVFQRRSTHPQALFGTFGFFHKKKPRNWYAASFLRHGDRELLVTRHPFVTIYEKAKGTWQPRSAIGSTDYQCLRDNWNDEYLLDAIPGYTRSPVGATIPRSGSGGLWYALGCRPHEWGNVNFIWTDLNGDGLSQPEEFETAPLWSVTLWPEGENRRDQAPTRMRAGFCIPPGGRTLFLEAETKSEYPDPHPNVPHVFAAERSKGWRDYTTYGLSGAQMNLERQKHKGALENLTFRWKLDEETVLAEGDYEVYLHYFASGSAKSPWFDFELDAGPAVDAMAPRVKRGGHRYAKGLSPGFPNYHFRFLRMGVARFSSGDRIIEVKIPWAQIPDLRVDCVVLHEPAGKIPSDIFGGTTATVGPDMTAYIGQSQIRLSGWAKSGAPLYKMADATDLPRRGGLMLATEDDKLIQVGSVMEGYRVSDMKRQWTYPNPYHGVHGSHKATAAHRGQFVGAFNITTDAALDGDKGRIFHITGNMGNQYLFTTDGLYVSELFSDSRTGKGRPSEYRRGMPMDDTCFGQESWSGTFFRDEKTGNYYAVCGKIHYSICRVDGLETLIRLKGDPLDFTPELHAEADKLTPVIQDGVIVGIRKPEEESKEEKSRKIVVFKMPKAPTIDGEAEDWGRLRGTSAEIRVDENRGAKIALAYDAKNLYLLYEVDDPNPWQGAGKSFEGLFETGDCVDLMLRCDPKAGKTAKPVAGDKRLLFAPCNNKTAAVLYDAVVPGSQKPFVFKMTDRVAKFDAIKQLENVQVKVAKTGKGYVLEASIPLAELGVKLQPGLKLQGDIGLLLSDAAGAETVVRAYVFNRKTAVTADAPSEARLQPAEWGDFVFKGHE